MIRKTIPIPVVVIWCAVIIVLMFALAKEVSATDELADLSWNVNAEYSDIPDNCAVVAFEKKKRLGRGEVKCVPVPKKYLPIQQHCYLEVDGYILDNGGLSELILD